MPTDISVTNIAHIEPFSIPNIGTFYKCSEAPDHSLYFVRFVSIPPHFHNGIREIFTIVRGQGVFTLYDDVQELNGKYYANSSHSRTVEAYEGMTVNLPPRTTHSLKVSNGTLDTHLVTLPKFDPNDEFQVEVR